MGTYGIKDNEVIYIPLYADGWGFRSCLQYAGHCHNGHRKGTRYEAPDIMAFLIRLSKKDITLPSLVFFTTYSLHQNHLISTHKKNLNKYQVRQEPNKSQTAVSYLPQWSIQLMDDHFYLLTASKGHYCIVACKGTWLCKLGHWRMRREYIYIY